MVRFRNHWEVEMDSKRQFYLDNANSEAAERRAKFYAKESNTHDRNLDFRPEEPNVRVYHRALVAVLETARAGLSPADFQNLVNAVIVEANASKGGVR